MSLENIPQACGNASPRSHPYNSSLLSSASSSSSSIFSDAASQTSNSSAATAHSVWESQEWSSGARSKSGDAFVFPMALAPLTRASTFPDSLQGKRLPPLRTDLAVPIDQRQHPRRSSTLNQKPPQLVRQTDRRVNFVDCLVDSATQMVEVIWPLSVRTSRCESASGRGVLPLRTYIQETLKRSRTSYSTLQVALYYLILIKGHVPKHDFTAEQVQDAAAYRALQCGRRMFLAALILASKYLQDRNYSAQAWSKMSGLPVCEINSNEMAFLEAVNWKLHITDQVWERWQEVVLTYTPSNPPPSPGACLANSWKAVIPHLSPELENIVVAPKTPVTPVRPELRQQFTQSAPRSHLLLSNSSGSQENTPTPRAYYQAPPRFLEPKAELIPPTPPLLRLPPLPTPCLTPLCAVSNTPAVSGVASGSRRASMCLAMAQAQSSSLARSCVDQFTPVNSVRTGLEAYHFPSRRPSLAPSNSSLASSPESMITDNSRSSRASSISSVSSAGLAPNRPGLARFATCRNAGLQYAVLPKCKEMAENVSSETFSSPPDFDSFNIDSDSESTPIKADSPTPVVAPATGRVSRKRGRSSVDLTLQQNVRHMLDEPHSVSRLGSSHTILPDRSVAQSFLVPGDSTPSCNGQKGLQSPKHTVSERRRPVLKDLGKKRSCCASEAFQQVPREAPGMWDGIL